MIEPLRNAVLETNLDLNGHDLLNSGGVTAFITPAGSYADPSWITSLAWTKITSPTTAAISDSMNKRFVTDAQFTVLQNTSGANSGDQDLSGYQLKGGVLALAGFSSISSTIPFANLPTGTSGSTVAIGNHTHTGVYQPADADLTTWAGLTPSANAQSLVTAADYSAMRTLLGLVIGTNVQAYDADLTTWAGITPGTGVGTALAVNVGSAGAFVTFNGALGTPSSGTLTNASGLPITGITSSTSAQLRTLLSDENGTGVALFDGATSPTFVTPALGTPSALVLTNATGSPTGISLTKAQLNTIVTDDDLAYLGAANTFTLNQVNSYSGTASTPAMKYSGVPFAGTGTTSFPLVYINDANATASTTLNTAGTYFGVNGDGTQDLMNLLKDGTSMVKANSGGDLVIARDFYGGGDMFAAAGSRIALTNRSGIDSSSDGLLRLRNNAGTDFTRLQFGGTTSSFPSIKRNGTALNFRLADDSADAPITSSTLTTSGAASIGTNLTLASSGGVFIISSRFSLESPSSGVVTLSNSGGTGLTRANFGLATNSAPALGVDTVNGFTLQSAAGTATWNDASTATSGTVANRYLFGIAAPTLTATNATVTDTVASTIYIGGAPTASTNTTIGTAWALNVAAGNVNFGGGLTLAGTLNGVTIDNAAWSTYTPTITAPSGTFTTLGTVTGRYKQFGKTVFVEIYIAITTNGTAASWVLATLPVTAAAHDYVLPGQNKISGVGLTGQINSGDGTKVAIFKSSDATYPGGDNQVLVVNGTYQAS